MTLGLYIDRSSLLHRLAPAVKLATLLAAGIGVFLVRDPLWLLPVLGTVLMLYAVAKIPPGEVWRQLRPLAVLMVLFLLAHGWLTTWTLGFLVVLRFAILVLAAFLVTYTTKLSAMIETLERAIAPLAPLGVNPAKVSLALSLALRFIPLLYDRVREIREAQRARGLERSVVSIAVPLLVRTLRMADDLTQALEARGFDATEPAPRAGRAKTRR
ncbi:MAG: energy-coupling factor transporter transmembrane protein EcfT [Rhodospirillales bacterium]|nr:MAG: energy-coupling factor transporter transmembrane protein EcfT [Rhodospirillales bacterium]